MISISLISFNLNLTPPIKIIFLRPWYTRKPKRTSQKQKTQLGEHMYTLAPGTSHKKGEVLNLNFLQAIYSMYITNNMNVTPVLRSFDMYTCTL